jgi:hypothetical protein
VQGLGEARRSPDAIELDTSGQTIDGRNRLRACKLAGVSRRPSWRRRSTIAYTLSCNLHRRHLTKALSIAAPGVYGLLSLAVAFDWMLTVSSVDQVSIC